MMWKQQPRTQVQKDPAEEVDYKIRAQSRERDEQGQAQSPVGNRSATAHCPTQHYAAWASPTDAAHHEPSVTIPWIDVNGATRDVKLALYPAHVLAVTETTSDCNA
jgi:hypothetical protein